MKEKELRECATCAICKRKIGKSGMPMFWRVNIERHALKLDAIRRQQGLAMALGGRALLASIMGPDEEMTEPLMEPKTITVCEDCCTHDTCVAQLAELAGG